MGASALSAVVLMEAASSHVYHLRRLPNLEKEMNSNELEAKSFNWDEFWNRVSQSFQSEDVEKIHACWQAARSQPAEPKCAVCDGPNTYDTQSSVCAKCQNVDVDVDQPSSDREALIYLMRAFDMESWQCPQCGHAEDCATMDSGEYLRSYLKFSASRPVIKPAAPRVGSDENIERAAKGMWECVPRWFSWNKLQEHIANDWRMLARAALEAIDPVKL